MIQIKYPRIPASVVAFNKDLTKRNNWGAFRQDPAYKDAKNILMKNQKNLCAYCMCKLTDLDKVSIEHILPREHYHGLRTDFNNMIAVCKNDMNHCDNSKKSNLLKVVDKELRNKIEDIIDYSPSGEIISRYRNKDLDNDLGSKKLLNLNMDFLKSRRLTILEEFENTYVKLAKKKRKKLRISSIDNCIDSLYKSEIPYKGVLINKLKKDFK